VGGRVPCMGHIPMACMLCQLGWGMRRTRWALSVKRRRRGMLRGVHAVLRWCLLRCQLVLAQGFQVDLVILLASARILDVTNPRHSCSLLLLLVLPLVLMWRRQAPRKGLGRRSRVVVLAGKAGR
jgi:hypothetical protein